MQTKILNETQINEAAQIIARGGVVAFPTETVYGLGADARNAAAVAEIFKAKGRPSDNPLIVHIADYKQIDELTAEVSEKARALMSAFWPGALTMVFKRKKIVPDIVTAGLDTVAVRMPSHPVAREIISLSGAPVAAPSANTSGKPSPTRFEHVFEDLNGKVDAIVKASQGNEDLIGVESSVVDMTGKVPVLLRAGGITLEQLQSVVGEVEVYKKEINPQSTPCRRGEKTDGCPRGEETHECVRSPGMKYKHYSPNARIVLVDQNNIDECIEIIKKEHAKKAGILTFDELLPYFNTLDCHVISLGGRDKPEQTAERLFLALREFDKAGADIIYAPQIKDEKGLWRAVKDRLYRAAGV